jgi:hypothetical protein
VAAQFEAVQQALTGELEAFLVRSRSTHKPKTVIAQPDTESLRALGYMD